MYIKLIQVFGFHRSTVVIVIVRACFTHLFTIVYFNFYYSPDSARSYLSKQAQKWVVDAGGNLTGDLDSICEVSPLTSYAGEGLEELVCGKDIHCPFLL